MMVNHIPGSFFRNVESSKLFVLIGWKQGSNNDPRNGDAMLLPANPGPLVVVGWDDFQTQFLPVNVI